MSNPPPKSLFRYADDFPVGTVCADFQDAETGLRAVVLRGPFSFCAYVGAPENHALYALEELEFSCHCGITYRGSASDLMAGAQGWYFFGWDYAHAWDRVASPELDELFKRMKDTLPQDVANVFNRFGAGEHKTKRWTVEEVTEDLFDALLELKYALARSSKYSLALRDSSRA
jgi:hypothetical protein